jgi:kinesin family protein 5
MRRGIEILRKELGELNDSHQGHPELSGNAGDEAAEELADDREHLREALSSALCSLAELLMGAAAEAADDAEDEDGAAAALAASPALVECEKLLGEARELWYLSPEPLQAFCSLRRLQGREDDALLMLRQSLTLWYRPSHDVEGEQNIEAQQQQQQQQQTQKAMDEDDEPSLPSYEFRFEAAKLLIELEETMETAADVLEGLLQENDTVPDVWLLLAVAYRAGGELEAAADAAKEGASTARKLGYPTDHEVVAALSELEAELGKLVVEGGKSDKEPKK